MSAVAKRYARAGVEAASERGGEDAVQSLAKGLREFLQSYDESLELQELLANPVFKAERVSTLQVVLSKAGFQNEVASLLLTLAEKDRMGVIHDVVREVQEFADEQVGRLRAVVQSVVELTDGQKSRLEAILSKRLDCDVVAEVEIDPSLMGGLVCRVGDLAFDSSLKRQLELIREQLQPRAN